MSTIQLLSSRGPRMAIVTRSVITSRGRDDFELSRGRNNCRPRHHEAAHLLDRLTEGDVLAGVEGFIESADRADCVARAELEAAADQADEPGCFDCEPNDDARPPLDRTDELGGTSAAGGAAAEGCQGCTDGLLVRLG